MNDITRPSIYSIDHAEKQGWIRPSATHTVPLLTDEERMTLQLAMYVHQIFFT